MHRGAYNYSAMLRHEAEGIVGRVAPILSDEDPLYYIYN